MTTTRKPKVKRAKVLTWTRWARVCGRGSIVRIHETEYDARFDSCTSCRVMPVEIRALHVRKRKS